MPRPIAVLLAMLLAHAADAATLPGSTIPSTPPIAAPKSPVDSSRIGTIIPPATLQPRITHYIAHVHGGTAYWYDASAQDRERFRSEALKSGAAMAPGAAPSAALGDRQMPGPSGPLPSDPDRGTPTLPMDPRGQLPPDPGKELPSEQGRPMLEVQGRYWRGGWIYELKRPNGTGFVFADVAQVNVDGAGVTTRVFPESCISFSVPSFDRGGCGTAAGTKAFVLFTVAPDAPHGIRQVSVGLKNGATEATQYPLLIGRYGTGAFARLSYLDLPQGPLTLTGANVRGLQGAESASDAPSIEIEIQGNRLGNARIVVPCLIDGGIQSIAPDERRIVMRARFKYTAGRTLQSNGRVTFTRPPSAGPFDQCPWIVYDQVMDQAAAWAPGFPGTLPENFNYLDDARIRYVRIGPSVRDFARRPAALGDSLAHGVYGVSTTLPTQMAAYPSLLIGAMGGRVHQPPPANDPGNRGLYMNAVRGMWNFEELIRRTCPSIGTVDFSELNPQWKARIGECFFHGFDMANVDAAPTDKPSHAGITGYDYTMALRTNGQCLDVLEKRTGCDTIPLVPERLEPNGVQMASLNGGTFTPIEVLEQIKPHFVMASVPGNHALGCALTTLPLDTCLDWGRFEQDVTEVFDRLARITDIRGGLVFSYPSPTSVAHLQQRTFRVTRVDFPNGQAPRLRLTPVTVLIPYWRLAEVEARLQGTVGIVQSIASFVAALAAPFESIQDNVSLAGVPAALLNQVAADLNRIATDVQAASLDSTEQARLDTFTRAMNAKMQELALRNRYAFVDAYAMFEQAKIAGLPIARANGTPLCIARAAFPFAGQAPNGKGCGVFSLDGFHPSRLGHAVLAKRLIEGLNAYYDLQIPNIDLGVAYQSDSLNQSPIDIVQYLRTNAVLGCSAPALSPEGLGQFVAQGGFLCAVNAPPTSYDGFVATWFSLMWNGNFLKGHLFSSLLGTGGDMHSFRAARQSFAQAYVCGSAVPTNWNPNSNDALGLWCRR